MGPSRELCLQVNPFASYSRESLLDIARSCDWVHTIALDAELTTRGLWGTGNPWIWRAMEDLSFVGRKVLDIGCWDGAYSFWAERAGASEIYATDLISQRDFAQQPTFQVAHALLRSRAKYYPNVSVYDIERLGVRDFDVVMFTGIYYHLKDPLRALTTLRRVMKDGGQIIVEGAILDRPGCYANFYYRDEFCGDRSNWWVPTPECLRQWVTSSYFDVEREYDRWGYLDNQRHCLLARAVRRVDPLYSRVPEYLEEFHRT